MSAVRSPLVPEANNTGDRQLRRIALAGNVVDYRLVRARRRTIGMQIGLDGLTVRAPNWIALREIESALTERATWILRGIAEWRRRQRDVLPREWKSGAPILYRGGELALAISQAATPSIDVELFHLRIRHPAPQDESRIAMAVSRWLRDEALRVIVPRLASYSARLRPSMPPLRLSNARSEWGSCNGKGEIRLNWRLVLLPPELADYVIAHEVAHLAELNHSPRFWAVVESLFPDHAAARRSLRDWTALLAA